ncbi:glycoside hydrolase family 3 N-terminal domain-containing protein [Actinocorallia populi]|uniref:glycoside hydrolase family 3 N-terminal domain-containing protein n=1 Tax=Actinocorallia populi TaxID=2079200 RepID=UPI0018E55A63|nr:glycoside hydrolase family 3 N-terminal domain-containing protein [Actinocorallia populi]
MGERVVDLIERMTLEEKAAQIASPFGSAVDVHAPPPTGWGSATAALSVLGTTPREAAEKANELQRKHVEETRLGIPVLLIEEALLGLKVRDATTFPDAIAQAATWDPDSIEEMGAVIGAQMAALGVRQALSPLADVARDPRWGRVGETYGEEPYLVGAMATAFVRGIQEAVPDVPLIATLKHFVAYGASEGGRNTEPAQLGERALRETYGVPFEMAIREGGAQGVMPSYNSIDGVPVTGSRELLTELLREEYGFNGLVISDLAAVAQLHTKHGVTTDVVGAYAQALRAGVDLDLDNRVSSDRVIEAVRTGALPEPDLDRAVASVLRAKFRLGLFERPYVDLEKVPESLDSGESRALARSIAEKSVVLLQNEPVDGTPLLPLASDPGTIAVIGPNADRPMGQLGHYSYQVLDSMTKRFALAADPQARAADAEGLAGRSGPDDAELLVESVPVVTFLQGIRDRAGADATVLYEQGCPVAREDRSGFAAAVRAAAKADVAIVVVGDQAGINTRGTVGEGLDSTDCALPGVQRELVEAVAGTGTPTVVVLSHARPFVLGWMADTVPAIVSSWFGGEEAGNAVANVLFGDVNPAGRLPIAMLESAGAAPVPYWRSLQSPAYTDGSIKAVFPFGHGLSYTAFEYRDLRIPSGRVRTDGVIRVEFTVANVGSRAGDEVVQVYGRDVHGRTARPARKLVAFRRLTLAPGEEERVAVDIPADLFALWDPREGWVVEPGAVKLFIGPSSAVTPLRGEVNLIGREHRPGAHRALSSTVTAGVEVSPAPSAAEESEDGDEEPVPVRPLTAESTVGDWFAHPVGARVLRSVLGGVDEETLAPAFGLTLEQMVMYSNGALPASLPGELLERAARESD